MLVGGRHALMMTGMSEAREDVRPVLTVTPEARATVLEVLANESESESLALWLEVSGEADGAYAYDMYFQALADASAGDVVQHGDDLPVVVPAPASTASRGRPWTSSPTRRVRAAWSSSTPTPRRRRR